MEKYFIEEGEYINITHEIMDIEETTETIDNLKVIFKTKENSREKML